MKKFMLWTHRWFGITIGLYFVALGITGSYLVYPQQFEMWLNPHLRISNSPAPTDFNLNEVVKSAQISTNLSMQPSSILIPAAANRNWEISFTGVPGLGRAPLVAFVDPHNNQFLGQQNFRETVHGYFFRFHHDLFMGRTGHTIVAVAGIMMLFLLIGGIYLWWPTKGNWRRALTLGSLKSFFQATIKLHKFLGFYTLLLMILVTFTGVYLSRPDWFQRSPASRPTPREATAFAEDEKIDFKKIGQQFLANEDLSFPVRIRIDRKSATITVSSGDGNTQVQNSYDARTLEPLPSVATKPFSMRKLQHDLHAGDFWSDLGKFLIFISGLLPLFFYVTGFYIWLKKSRRPQHTERVRL